MRQRDKRHEQRQERCQSGTDAARWRDGEQSRRALLALFWAEARAGLWTSAAAAGCGSYMHMHMHMCNMHMRMHIHVHVCTAARQTDSAECAR